MAHVVEHAYSDGNLFYVFIGINIRYSLLLFVEYILLLRFLIARLFEIFTCFRNIG